MDVYIFLLIYVLVINFIGFTLMGSDKKRARKHAFRIPEATLFIVAFLGGAIGSIIGMRVFRHKTRHWYFVWGMPAIVVLHILLVYFIIEGPIRFMTI